MCENPIRPIISWTTVVLALKLLLELLRGERRKEGRVELYAAKEAKSSVVKRESRRGNR